jgi:hypothetical protein
VYPVELTATPSGELIREYLTARRRGIRSHLYAKSVLRIPPGEAPILRGRSFRAARTNTTRARSEGITCRDLRASERLSVLRELGEPEWLLDRTVDRWWMAEAPDGSAVGLALATVDERWAMLNILVAPRYTARYLLHTHLVSQLQAAGVRYVIAQAPSPLVLDPGLVYLQGRLGYEVANLRLSGKHAGALRRAGVPPVHPDPAPAAAYD